MPWRSLPCRYDPAVNFISYGPPFVSGSNTTSHPLLTRVHQLAAARTYTAVRPQGGDARGRRECRKQKIFHIFACWGLLQANPPAMCRVTGYRKLWVTSDAPNPRRSVPTNMPTEGSVMRLAYYLEQIHACTRGPHLQQPRDNRPSCSQSLASNFDAKLLDDCSCSH